MYAMAKKDLDFYRELRDYIKNGMMTGASKRIVS